MIPEELLERIRDLLARFKQHDQVWYPHCYCEESMGLEARGLLEQLLAQIEAGS